MDRSITGSYCWVSTLARSAVGWNVWLAYCFHHRPDSKYFVQMILPIHQHINDLIIFVFVFVFSMNKKRLCRKAVGKISK